MEKSDTVFLIYCTFLTRPVEILKKLKLKKKTDFLRKIYFTAFLCAGLSVPMNHCCHARPAVSIETRHILDIAQCLYFILSSVKK